MTFFIKFFSAALSETPILNSLYDPSNPFEFATYQNHNITIAIDTSNGLAVPNIKNVQNLSLFQIQEELTRLRTLAESAKLTKADI
jgi:2-oxoisovalerate dehydrogenase E2 component (dihydrolipoyl transacylase)